MRRTRRAAAGFTIIELMVVVAVAAILLTLAAPSFYEYTRLQRLKSVNAQLVTDLQYARTEAAARYLAVNVRVQPPNAANPRSCYILFTDTGGTPSQRCDCHRPAGSRCTLAGTREIRTVSVETSGGVRLSTPAGQPTYFAFDPITSGILVSVTEAGGGPGIPFAIQASLDTPRSLMTLVAATGRPSVCRPDGSTMPEPECPATVP